MTDRWLRARAGTQSERSYCVQPAVCQLHIEALSVSLPVCLTVWENKGRHLASFSKLEEVSRTMSSILIFATSVPSIYGAKCAVFGCPTLFNSTLFK